MVLRTENPIIPEQILWEWSQKGVKNIADLYEGGILRPFNSLTKEYGMRGGDFLTYGTVAHTVRKLWG